MDEVTQHLPGVYVYLDDVLVASASPEQHMRHLRQLFHTLRRFGLVVNRNKCVFGAQELDFLGHRVSAAGVCPLPEKVSAVREYKIPQTLKSLQRFLGMLNFYRRFLPNIAAVLRLLTDALAGTPKHLVWTPSMTSAFEEAKRRLARAALLVHPRSGAELRLRTDASERAIAGAVHQVTDGQEQPLAFSAGEPQQQRADIVHTIWNFWQFTLQFSIFVTCLRAGNSRSSLIRDL